jgi:glycosyltransferase involved in cell wall biosynthesis
MSISPSNNADTLVSILTPSFNQGRFLADCIRSVAGQSYGKVEHVVCDGGSTDSTRNVLSVAPGTVRWISEPDRGQSHALNKALAMSRGEIIGWLNSDDAYLDPRAIEAAVQRFLDDPTVDVLYGHAALANADGLILQLRWVPPFSYRLLRFETFIVQPSVFMRRGVLSDGFADEEYHSAMDMELWLRLARKHRFGRLDRVLAIDRHHPARKVYTRPDLTKADEQRLIARYGIPPYRRLRLVRRAFRVAIRLLSLRLIPAAFEPHACKAHTDGASRLVLRQLVVPRRMMPVGDSASLEDTALVETTNGS